MPDHGRDLTFGTFLVPNASVPLLDAARDIEGRGLDWIGIQDHPYQRRFVDTFVLMSAIAAATTRVGVFPDVANLPLRPPAMLAKAAASIDVLSGGRFELGLGAGAFWDAIEGYGGPRRTPGVALDALAEAITVIRLIWSGERNLRFDGRHYRLAGVHSGPTPVHDIGIWLGVYGPRALVLAGRVADGWVPSLRDGTGQLAAAAARLDDAAAAAGRSPADIRRVLNVNGRITDGTREGLLRGPADQWVDELTDLAVGFGFDTFLFSAEGPDQLPRFAEEVVPAVRAQVAAERAG
ncbi:LLM class flavin-dependent oxidoreductase [Asanoa sp. NPDC049573]|uniref:LLM class flavin-dependent oxidoreductase n=1 Tax=Asanoa sp. NPDC049573 TaxID=3155396 RepID=UPI0034172B59